MANDPHRDWRIRAGRYEGQAADEVFSDQMSVLKFLLKLPFLIITLPFRLYGIKKRKDEMREFALQRAKNRLITDDLIKDIALEWAQLHLTSYPLGEYDPKLPKLRQTFKKMLAKNTRQ